MPPTSPHYDVAVIGGGIIGAACATALLESRPQRRAAIVESGEPGSGATGAAAGLVSLLTKRPEHLALAAESIRLHEEWRCRASAGGGHGNGLLLVFDSRQDAEAADRFLDHLRRFEPWVTRLSPEDVWDMEPNYIGKRFGALYSAESRRLDAPALTQQWLDRLNLARFSAMPAEPGPDRLLLRDRAVRLETAGDRWRVIGSTGSLTAARVVVAAGADTAGLLAPLGWTLPVRSRRGQVARTKPMPGYLRRSIVTASYLTDKFDDPPPLDPDAESSAAYSFTAIADEQDRLWLGSTRRFSDDGSLREDERVRILDGAGRRLKEFRIDWIEAEFAGRRPWTPDGLPLIGSLPELDGLCLAAGHEGDGVTLAPVTGELVTDVIDRRPMRMDMCALRPDRFGRVWMPTDSQSDTA